MKTAMLLLNAVSILGFLSGSVRVLADDTSGEMPDMPEMSDDMPKMDHSAHHMHHEEVSTPMLMLHGNAFGVLSAETGPRGLSAVSIPDMLMADLGTPIGDRHYLNLSLMATAERWLYPARGYPELLQIGEENEAALPYIDAQHPHSSPIMGLTLSDTIRLPGERNLLKLFAAPRGESTDGPIAFMHRPTGVVNPDAPLGHHIGQDVGHISSTVIGAQWKIASSTLEASAFNGTEPSPTAVDLPLGTPNSFSFRAVQEFSPSLLAMASFAYVASPEPQHPDVLTENRYSASIYTEHAIFRDWKLNTASILGVVTGFDHATSLFSVAEEFLLRGQTNEIWGRLEALQRTPDELSIPLPNPNQGLWVGAVTAGYTHQLFKNQSAELGLGGSGTLDILPADLASAYGSSTPFTAKMFLQLSGMGMWNL